MRITDELAALRVRANWAFLLPKAGRRRDAFRRRLDEHLSRAEPGSLAVIAEREPEDDTVDTSGGCRSGCSPSTPPAWSSCVHWRCSRSIQQAKVARGGRRGRRCLAVPSLRAGHRATVAHHATGAESTAATSWRGTRLHRRRCSRVRPYTTGPPTRAVRRHVTPEAWLNGAQDLPGCPVQRGTGRCPAGTCSVVTSAMLAEFLRQGVPTARAADAAFT